MRWRAIPALVGFCVVGLLVATMDPLGLSAAAGDPARTPYLCYVTLPNGSMPPGYDPTPFHDGNGKLWVDLWAQGIVLVTPSNVQPDGTLRMKFPWWRAVQGHLTIEGHRLDAAAPPLRAEIGSDNGYGRFQPTILLFPTEGCWEVTGKVGNASLTFVTLVLRSPALAVPGTPTATR